MVKRIFPIFVCIYHHVSEDERWSYLHSGHVSTLEGVWKGSEIWESESVQINVMVKSWLKSEKTENI